MAHPVVRERAGSGRRPAGGGGGPAARLGVAVAGGVLLAASLVAASFVAAGGLPGPGAASPVASWSRFTSLGPGTGDEAGSTGHAANPGEAGTAPGAGSGDEPGDGSGGASGEGPGGGSGATAAVPPGASARVRPAATPPACARGDPRTPAAGQDEWSRTILDTTLRLPASYAPPDLVPLEQAGLSGGRVRAFVIPDLRAMVEAAAADGVGFEVQSGYRSFERQRDVFEGWVASVGRAAAERASARPGHSEHQLGTTLDLREAGGPAPWSGDFAATPAGQWLAANAWTFGFVLSYPDGEEDVTCYAPEPWHIRYVGRDTARAVHDAGVPLRAWLWANGGS